jgi:hypothetical protein
MQNNEERKQTQQHKTAVESALAGTSENQLRLLTGRSGKVCYHALIRSFLAVAFYHYSRSYVQKTRTSGTVNNRRYTSTNRAGEATRNPRARKNTRTSRVAGRGAIGKSMFC